MEADSTSSPSRSARAPATPAAETAHPTSWRERLYVVIFEADSPAGKTFDVLLLAAIGLSVAAVMLESVASVRERHGFALRVAEWVFTGLFTLEYGVRLFCVRRPIRYAFSFFGIVDLLAVLPAYLSLLLPGSQSLATIRALRLLRVFRVFKLARFLAQADTLVRALLASREKVIVFLGSVTVIVVILGSAMYWIEGEEAGFVSIPESVYWAIVTITTVGYGDIAPVTPLGKAIAAFAMVLGYAIIAVPTGIVTSEIVQAARREPTTHTCPGCLSTGHDVDARFCKRCGEPMSGVG